MPVPVPAVQRRAPRKIAQNDVASFPLLERPADSSMAHGCHVDNDDAQSVVGLGKLLPNAAMSVVVRLREQRYAGQELFRMATREVS